LTPKTSRSFSQKYLKFFPTVLEVFKKVSEVLGNDLKHIKRTLKMAKTDA